MWKSAKPYGTFLYLTQVFIWPLMPSRLDRKVFLASKVIRLKKNFFSCLTLKSAQSYQLSKLGSLMVILPLITVIIALAYKSLQSITSIPTCTIKGSSFNTLNNARATIDQ